MIASLILMLLPLAASANTYLSNIRLRMEMPAVVSPNQEIYVDFQYSTNQSPHMLVFITPLFEGNYITAYASGSSHYTPGSGFGSGFIRLNAGQKVDQLAVFAIDSDMKVILDKVLLPVDMRGGRGGHYGLLDRPAGRIRPQ